MNSHITATPLINSYKSGSLPASPHHSRLTPNLRSPKYLIASPACGTPIRRPSERGGSPLLNSTVNVSLYTNTQSPGLASRIVQYDRAQNGSSPTYNRKFSSPGMFPIVHLGKQIVPVASPKPKKVTVKIAPPDDMSMYNHIDHSIIMSENSRITTFPPNETGTRSVLDALKEISRKRIHSAAEFDASSPEGSNRKRNKRILESTTPTQSPTPQLNNNKRVREESPPDMNCLTVSSNSVNPTVPNEKSTWKRYCSIDPITASFTSANLRLQELRKGPAKNALKFPEDLPESPLRKTQQVSVDTQTNLPETVETPEEITCEAIPAEKPREAPLFDPRPLEVIRRNKLAALLGAINGEKPILEKVPLPNSLDTPPQKQATPITTTTTSIVPISTAPKHVTFDLPIDVPPPILTNPNITQTTTSLVMPIASTMIAPPSIISSAVPFMASTAAPTPSVNTVAPVLQTPPKVLGGFKFDLQNNFAPNQPTDVLSTSISASINEVPKFGCQFSTPKTTEQQFDAVSFGLPTQSSSTVAQTTPNFSFGTAVATATSSTFGFGTASSVATSSVPQPPTFSFATKPAAVVTCTASTLALFGGTTTNMFAKPTIASSPFQTNSAVPSIIAAATTTTIGSSTTVGFPLTTSSAVSIPKLGHLGDTTLFAPAATKPFSFGTSNTSLTTSSATNITFGGTAAEKPAPSFGSIAEKPSAPPSFSNAATANTIFGASPFAPPSIPASTTHSTFGTVTTKTNTLPIKFGDTTPAAQQQNLFSFAGTPAPTEPQKMFANVNGTATFNNKEQLPSFGATKMTFGGFGNSTPPNSTFGNTNQAPLNSTSSNGTFGGTNQAILNTTISNGAFGGTNQAILNAAPSNGVFGSTNQAIPNPTPSNNTFGSTNHIVLNPTVSNSTFGGTNQSVLEVAPPNQTVQPTSNSTFSFGPGGGFGSTTDSAFNKPASFDANTNSTNTFGVPNTSYNNPTAAAAFGAPQSKLFTFGTATATPKPDAPSAIDKASSGGVFAFGTSIPKPHATTGGFNFSSATANTSSPFGSGVPAFGTPNGAPVMQFGAGGGAAPQPAAFNVGGGGGFAAPPGLVGGPGMFSIGSGSSSGPSRPRTQLKTKRRT